MRMGATMGWARSALLVAFAATSVVAAPKKSSLKPPEPSGPPPVSAIAGQAFIQTSSGMPRTCAGQDDVLILPETASATVSAYFSSTTKGFVSNGSPPLATAGSAKTAPCDATGAFKFTDLTPGSYFIVSHITWAAGQQGGWLMKRVEVAPGQTGDAILSSTVEDAPPPPEPPKRDPREVTAEQAVRAQLFDPNSAEFEWPGRWNENRDFKFWRWSKPIHGDYTCGKVNAHNRMGGYVGQTYFLVVVSDGAIAFLQLDTSGDSDLSIVRLRCQKEGF